MPDIDMQDAFRRIITSANAIKERTAVATPTKLQVANPTHGAWDEIRPSFRPVADVVDVLVSDGLPSPVAQKLSTTFQRSLENMQTQLQSGFLDAWAKVVRLPRSSSMTPLVSLRIQMCKAYESMYDRRRAAWIADIRQLASNRLSASRSMNEVKRDSEAVRRGSATDRPTFNQACLPVLEACFAKNRMPSRADKMLVAEKTGMSYRQIHVWFQNRRSRSNKANNVTKGSNTKENTETVVDTSHYLCSASECTTLIGMSSSMKSRSSSVPLVDLEVDQDQAFANANPAFAFPVPYPPKVEEDPFPCRFGDFSCFFKPDWPRQPATKLRNVSEPDIDALCLTFAGLRIEDTTQPLLQRKSKRTPKGLQVPSKEPGCDVTSPYTVRPLRAPLVSLIRNFASRMIHRSGKPSHDAQRSQRKVVATPVVDYAAQPALCKTKFCQTPASRGIAVSADQNSAPSVYWSNEPITSSTHNSSAASACASSTDQASKIKKSTKKSSSSRRVPAASASKRSKGRRAPVVQAVEPSAEPSTSHPSPTASVDSLPSLSYSSGSSSASSYSQSPTTSFVSLSDDGFLPSLDLYQPSNSSLMLPPAQGHSDDFPPRMFASSGEMPLDFSKGPLDLTFDLDLPTYPSYSESFDSILRGLQSSPDFAPPALTLDLTSFTV